MTTVRGGRVTTSLLAVALTLTVGWSPVPEVELAPRTLGLLEGQLSAVEDQLGELVAPVVQTVASTVDDLPTLDGPVGEVLASAGWSGSGKVGVPPSSAVAFELPAGLGSIWVRGDGPAGAVPWTLLELVDPEDGPDGAVGEVRRVTDQLWVRAADEIEVLVPVGTAIDEITVHLTDTLGLREAAAEGEDALDELLGALLEPLDALDGVVSDLLAPSDPPAGSPPPSAAPKDPQPRRASSARPDVIRRSAWGATRNTSSHATARPRAVVVHHTATRNDYSRKESPAIVRAIQHHHQRTMGWSDVGYNALIDRYGQVFEGRAGGIEAGVVGAHARGYNTGSYGVALIGNFEDARPPKVVLERLADVTAWQARVHGIDLRDGARANVGGRSISTFLGHRDVGQTACPGRHVLQKMTEVRRAAANARR